MNKILIFSLAYYPRVSGAEIAVKEITDRISPNSIEFSMVTMRFSSVDAPVERIGNVEVYRVGGGASYLSKILFIPRAALFALKLHRKEHFTGLWALMSYMALPVALMRLQGVRVPYVQTLQDGDPFEHVFNRKRIRPFRWLLTSGFKRASVVQVISNYLGTWARAIGFTGPIEVVPNGVNLSLYMQTISKTDIDVCRKKFDAEVGDVWLVHTGRLVKKNGLDVVIRAMPSMPTSAKLLLIGAGVEEESLKKLAAECGVSSRVCFFGPVENALLPAYLQACDIFIRPSRTEGLGTSFLEAFAVGLPVIATQEGGIADFLFDSTRNPGVPPTGFAVDRDSSEQISAAVENILHNPELVEEVVANAKQLVRQKYDWDGVAQSMEEKVFNRLFN